jgi:hypothetical protein
MILCMPHLYNTDNSSSNNNNNNNNSNNKFSVANSIVVAALTAQLRELARITTGLEVAVRKLCIAAAMVYTNCEECLHICAYASLTTACIDTS